MSFNDSLKVFDTFWRLNMKSKNRDDEKPVTSLLVADVGDEMCW